MDPIFLPFEYCGHRVPGLWRYLLPEEARGFKLPRERRATCDNCPMACFQGHDPLYRCCAYHPQVPNFLLGLAMEAGEKARVAVGELERANVLVPEGYQRSHGQWLDYLADLKDDKFDANTRVKCPLLEKTSGLCNIYAFRNAVCSTFFCYNDHGDRGDSFWKAMEEMISYVELAISQWALTRCGFDVPAYYRKLESLAGSVDSVTDPVTRGWSPRVLESLWGDFLPRKRELFAECARHVSENRNDLWNIALSMDVLDAKEFEKAGIRGVPKELEEEIDPSDLDETEETLSLPDLWDEVRECYDELWKVPERVTLSPRAKLVSNPRDDKESRAFGHLPRVLQYLKRTGGKSWEWREFLSDRDGRILESFLSPRSRQEAESLLAQAGVEDPRGFLAEWHGKRVLEVPKASRAERSDPAR